MPGLLLFRLSARARILALLPLAALGVHQLRFQLAFGHEADHQLATEGHAYLGVLSPLWVVVAAAIAAELIGRITRARRGHVDAERRCRFTALATASAVALIAIYAGQELLEGILSTGHPSGLAGVFGDGGWWSIPLAALFGVVIALFVNGAARAVTLVARRHRIAPRRAAAARAFLRPADLRLPRPSPLAAAAAGRAPPGTTPIS